jgi:hypothetical protein
MVNEALRAAPGPSPLPNSPRPSDFGDIVKKETNFKVNDVLKKIYYLIIEGYQATLKVSKVLFLTISN